MVTRVLLATGIGIAAVAESSSGVEGAPLQIGPGDLRIELAQGATPPERRAAELFAAEVRQRTGLGVPIGKAQGKYALVVGTAGSKALAAYCARHGGGRYRHPEAAGLAPDGFHLMLRPGSDRRLCVVGQSPSGVVAGVGRLLRLMRYGQGSAAIPAKTLTEAPRMPVRGIYFATHFENFYHVAPLEEVDRVIEDFALWGGNSLCVWFDMHHFRGFDDPAARAHFARLKHFGETAHRLGMQFGLTFIANEAYNTSPEALRARWLPGWPHYHVELCPSKPEGLALIGKWQAEELDAFPAVDFIWMWPYDQGGCACDECKPWGANGFLRASKQLAGLYRKRFPGGKAWLSTWLLDGLQGSIGEYDGLLRVLRDEHPDWVDGILTGTHGDHIPHQLLARPTPERYPLTCFPEISMYGMSPWGGHGANPLPAFCTRLAADARPNVQGGWPYSEGIYEDLNKFFWARFFWAPGQATDDVLRDYAAYYLAPEVSGDAVRLFHLLEATHQRSGWRVRNLEQAEEAWGLVQSIVGRLPAWARASWRWRLLYLRAAIDHTLKRQGYAGPEAQAALKPLCDEIVRLYHAEKSFIRPPSLPGPRDPANLAVGRPVTVSSVHPDCKGTEPNLTDGVLAQDDGENFWAHDPGKERMATLVLDLGGAKQVREVRLQFRGLYGQFWFVPSSVAFEVSEDGERYEPAGASQKLPREGSEYSPEFWVYPIGRQARYLRLTLGPSQHAGDQYAGTLELTEIEVY